MNQENYNSGTGHEYEIPKFLDKNVKNLNNYKDNSKKKNKGFLIGIGLVLILGLIYVLVPKSESVDVFNFVSVSYDGKEGSGVPVLKIVDKIDKPVVREGVALLDFTFSPESELSSGDDLIVEAVHTDESRSYFKKNHLKIENSSKTYKVGKLVALDSLDVFSFLTVQFDGLEGLAKVNLEINEITGLPSDLESLIRTIQFSVDNAENLSSGDRVMIEFDLNDTELKQIKKAGYEVGDFEREYEVSSLSIVPQTMENIPGLQDFKLEALEKAEDRLVKSNKNFRGFKEVYACYTSMASRSNQIEDFESGELVEEASLLMVISYEEKKFFSNKLNHAIFAFSHVSVDQGQVDRSVLTEILKPYEQEPLANIIRTLKQNNFNCFPS